MTCWRGFFEPSIVAAMGRTLLIAEAKLSRSAGQGLAATEREQLAAIILRECEVLGPFFDPDLAVDRFRKQQWAETSPRHGIGEELRARKYQQSAMMAPPAQRREV